MRNLNRLIWSAVFALAVSAPASAQQGGGGQGGGGFGGGGQGGGGQGGGQGGGGFGGGGQGGGGMGGGGQGSSQPSQNQFNLTQIESAPTISAPGTSTGGGGILDASNWLGPTYGNPYYQGIPANAKGAMGPGGFGAVLYGTSGGARGGSIGSAAAGGAAGARGAAGGIGGRGGIGGAANNATQFGTIVQPPVQISFQAVAKFKVAPVEATKLQSDVAGMISRSAEITNPGGIQVIAQGSNVTIRGAVKDADEARVVVGMVRLTPGVHRVTSELTFPRP